MAMGLGEELVSSNTRRTAMEGGAGECGTGDCEILGA